MTIGKLPVVVCFACGLVVAACGSETAPQSPPVTTAPQGFIAFAADRNEYGEDKLYVVNADGTNLRLVADPVSPAATISWSPDASRIAFNAGGKIEIVNVETKKRSLVVDLNLASQAHWSPDGESLAFMEDPEYGDPCGYIICNPEIYRVRVDGSNLTRLTDHEGFWDLQPVWSPDGRRIAFAGSRPAEPSEVYSIKSDGSDMVQLTDSKIWGDPVWKPDTNLISYLDNVGDVDSDEPITFELFLVSADGGVPHRFTERSMDVDTIGGFAWSPDGNRLAYVALRDGLSDVYIVSGDDTNEIRLTEDDFDEESLSWSPDGDHVAFMSDRDGTDEVWVIGRDGLKLIRITSKEITQGPVWSPIP